jgi:hypothetical protein
MQGIFDLWGQRYEGFCNLQKKWKNKYFLYFCLTKQMTNAKQTFYL